MVFRSSKFADVVCTTFVLKKYYFIAFSKSTRALIPFSPSTAHESLYPFSHSLKSILGFILLLLYRQQRYLITFILQAKIHNYFHYTSNINKLFKMKCEFRSNCPVASALDIVGDKWTLLIIKMMVLEGKRTFKDFFESDESIASNILSSRLKMLEEFEIIRKEKLPHNKKTNIYILTQKGLELTPTVIELALWSVGNILEEHPTLVRDDDQLEMIKINKEETIKMLIEDYKDKTGFKKV